MQGGPLIVRVCIGAALLSATMAHTLRGMTVVTVACTADLILPRGDPASVVANAVGGVDLRSGNPNQTSTVTLATALTPNTTVTSISFSYQYLAGYSPSCVEASNFTLLVVGSAVYTSPALGNYSYDINRTGYSPTVNVEVHSLAIAVPASGGSVEFIFHNNDRNLQIRLPVSFTIGCEGASACADVVWSPPAGLTRVFSEDEIGDNGKACACFRIPAIARAPDGTLLAFAEGRCASCWPDVRAGNTIVMKRSLDGGRGNQWSNFTTLAYRAGNCGMNYPTPMVDRVSERVWLFYYCSCDINITWLITSDDSGHTWSEPVNMTAAVTQFHFAMAGAGGGIQLRTGRLVVLCSGILANKTDSCGALAACYSDDHGKTWLRGANIPCGVGVHGLGEASVTHVDGRPGGDAALTAFVRVGSGSALLNHALAESADGGATWSAAVLVPEIVGPTCAGSIGPAGSGEALLSAPFSHDAGLSGRENLFVWRVNLSDPGSPSVETAGRLWPCAASYSHFSEDGLLNLFEGGPVMRYQHILLARMNTTSI